MKWVEIRILPLVVVQTNVGELGVTNGMKFKPNSLPEMVHNQWRHDEETSNYRCNRRRRKIRPNTENHDVSIEWKNRNAWKNAMHEIVSNRQMSLINIYTLGRQSSTPKAERSTIRVKKIVTAYSITRVSHLKRSSD